MRPFILAGSLALLAALSGCSTSQIAQLQSGAKADQDAVLAVSKAAGDKDLMRCAEQMDAIASVDCPAVTDPISGKSVPGPACSAAKAYLVTQAGISECAGVNAKAKSGFLTILSALGIVP